LFHGCSHRATDAFPTHDSYSPGYDSAVFQSIASWKLGLLQSYMTQFFLFYFYGENKIWFL
ncbi:hypothetical protein, partial [Paenisporosarcina sp. TG-14]|uniref:hypothetical protein n=1 Tax=Paenisporosarcina sp. TG-14 TaxID=1231057 RepID=UPI0004748BE8